MTPVDIKQKELEEKKFQWLESARIGNHILLLSMINHGHDINQANPYTALMYAASNGHMLSLELLVHHGADLDILDKNNLSALSCALISQLNQCAKFLVEKGAKVREKDLSLASEEFKEWYEKWFILQNLNLL